MKDIEFISQAIGNKIIIFGKINGFDNLEEGKADSWLYNHLYQSFDFKDCIYLEDEIVCGAIYYPETNFLHDIYVIPNLRRLGVSTQMHDWVEENIAKKTLTLPEKMTDDGMDFWESRVKRKKLKISC